jgi:hypothetical protein
MIRRVCVFVPDRIDLTIGSQNIIGFSLMAAPG